MTTKPKSKTKTTKPTTKPAPPPEIAESMKAASVLWGIPVAVLRAAKAAGCQGFKGARVFRSQLMAWLKANSDVADQATAASLDQASKAELEMARLRAQTRLAISKADAADRVVILKTEALAEWSRAAAIVEEEYRAFLEPQEFAVAQRRAKLRIGNLLGDDLPQQSDPAGVY